MQEGSILVLEQEKKDFKKEKDPRAGSRLLLFLPKLILITLLVCLILFLGDLVYCVAQYYLTGGILYFFPEASQVINFARSSTGLFGIGTVLAIILFVIIFRANRANFEKKNEILNDEHANETEGSEMFQAMIEIEEGDIPEEEGDTPEQVVPLPVKKKALKKIYGKSREQKEIKNEEEFFKKNKPNNKRKGYYSDYNDFGRGNVVMFKQKRPSFRKRAYRSITPRMAAANRIKWSTQTHNGK